jgi:glutathione S-transferase
VVKLYYHPGNASLIVHLLLEEIGAPFALELVDRAARFHKSTEYLKLNPNGLIPVLVDGDLVLYETAAICLHLVDKHPHPGLAPASGTSERSQFYKWLVWSASTLQPMLFDYFYPGRMVNDGNAAAAAEVKAHAEAKVGEMLDQVEAQLASHGRDWFLGDAFSAVDPYVFVLCRWTRGFSAPARHLPHVGPHLQRMLARTAVQRAFATEKLQQPFV